MKKYLRVKNSLNVEQTSLFNVTSLLRSPGLFSVFWSISAMLLPGWSRFFLWFSISLVFFLSLWDHSKYTNYHWYHRHPHVPQLFISMARPKHFLIFSFSLIFIILLEMFSHYYFEGMVWCLCFVEYLLWLFNTDVIFVKAQFELTTKE